MPGTYPRGQTPWCPGGERGAACTIVPPMSIAQHLIAELRTQRVHSVAFVVPSDAGGTSPLYDLALTIARCGWQLGIPATTYWFVTPEPDPQANLEDEGITFIGSTYAEVRDGVVLLDPQDDRIEPDRIVSLNELGVDQLPIAA
jgi:hypothetical protein